MRWRRPGRRLLAPEVIQTSTVDCGPAALKSVLNGFGISANLGRLREACQTQLDGTSIDSIEDIAGRLGLLAEQVIVPLEHVFLPGAGTLPAIAVTDTPDGTLHFVVLWRVLGPWVQVMDPRVGRRWARVSVLSRQLHVHSMLMPAQDWRAWAGSPANTGALRHRAMRLGLGRRRARTLLRRAEGDEAWHGFAILDAALRMVSALVGRGGVLRGAEAARLAASLVRRAEAGGLDAAIPNPFRAVQAMAADAGDLLVQGVVLLAVRGRMARPAGPDPAFAEIGAILSEADPKPLRVVAAAALADGFLRLTVVGLALFALSSLVVVEGLLLRGLLGLSQSLAPGLQRLVAVTLILGFFVVQLMVEAATQAELLRLGRAVEARLRILFLGKMRTLDLSYFQSRPTSDLADRCHNLHALRAFPLLLAQILRAALVLSTTTFGLLWLIPGAAAIVLPLLGVALAVPLLLQPVLMERDLRFRTQAGALTRFYLDALLGMTPIRAHSAERSVLIEHESFLVDWRQTGLQLLLANLWIGAAEALIGVVLAMAAVSLYSGRDAEHGNLLLLAFWAMSLPMLAQAAAQSVQAYPNLRSIGLRLLEPLGVFGANNARQGEADAAASTPAAPGEGVRIEMRGIRLRAGASLVLDGIDLDVAPGSHIAIVGPSGSGKSSLVGLLLGWRRPSEGELVVDGRPFDAPRLREQTAWVDPSVQLWNESLFDNIVYGARGEDMGSMGDALSSGDLRGFVGRLPDGLQTALGENGALASGGEGQRVRFARAMMRPEARLVILDEAFRGLDRDARHRLLARARAKWPRATLLCVTHDVGETRAFARVIVMDGGRIVEDDDPERLAARETSRYRAFLDAEREVANRLWAGAMWQRWRIRDATLHRDPRMQDTGGTACRDDADASG